MTYRSYDQRTAAEVARDALTERQRSLFWGLGVGVFAGASAYALYAARRDRDGLSHRPAEFRTGAQRETGAFRGVCRRRAHGDNRPTAR